MRFLKSCVAATLVATAVLPAAAAEIDWALGPTFGGALGHQGILTNGTVVQAVDLFAVGGASSVVDPGGLNLTFTSFNSPFFNATFTDPANGIGDAAWSSIVRTFEWNSTGDVNAATFLSGLTPGETYQVQFFSGRSNTCCSGRTLFLGDGLGNVSPGASQAALAFQSIVGTFVADAATQRIVFDDSPANAPTLSAYVLLESPMPVPEPGTWALMLGGVGLLLARRRFTR
jgi:hypothetical protein